MTGPRKATKPKTAREYIAKSKNCPFVVNTYNPPYVPYFTCYFFRDDRTTSGYPVQVPCFKKACSKNDWAICPYNLLASS